MKCWGKPELLFRQKNYFFTIDIASLSSKFALLYCTLFVIYNRKKNGVFSVLVISYYRYLFILKMIISYVAINIYHCNYDCYAFFFHSFLINSVDPW